MMRRYGAATLLIGLCLFAGGCGQYAEKVKNLAEAIGKSTEATEDATIVLQKMRDSASVDANKEELHAKMTNAAAACKTVSEIVKNSGGQTIYSAEADLRARKSGEAIKRVSEQIARLQTVNDISLEFWKTMNVDLLELMIAWEEGFLDIATTIPPSARKQNGGQIETVEAELRTTLAELKEVRGIMNDLGYENVVRIRLPNGLRVAEAKLRRRIEESLPSGVKIHKFCEAGSGVGYCLVYVGPYSDVKKLAQALKMSSARIDKGQRTIYFDYGAEIAAKDAETFRQTKEKINESMQETVAHEKMNRAKALELRSSMPDQDDPKYVEKLIEIASAEHGFDREKAISALLAIEPSSVTADDRKKIAVTFRDLAQGDSHFGEKQKIIKGLAKWGGKYSVPILLEMLDGRFPDPEQKAIYAALAQLKDPRGAKVIAKKLGDFHMHASAVGALRTMGTNAEDALLEVAPSSDPQICLAAIELLDEACGTKKSLAYLRKAASSSRNPEVRRTATSAIKNIMQRQKDAEKNADEDEK